MAAKSAESRDVWFVAAPDFFGGESLESAAFHEKGGSSLISYCSAVLEINHLDHNRLPQSHTASHINNVNNGTYFLVVAFVSKELVLLAHKCDFALEVCEIRSDGDLPFTLPMVCILKLPSLHPSTCVQFYMYDEERGVGILTIFETAEGKGQWEWASLLTSSRRQTFT